MSKLHSEILDVRNKLMNVFEMRDLTNDKKLTFLGLNITKTNYGLFIDQKELIQKVLAVFNMSNCRAVDVPIQHKLDLEFDTTDCNNNLPYRELIGYLMYIMLGSRPDLCYAITYFSKFQNCYSDIHWKHLKNVLRYLKGTENLGLRYNKTIHGNLCDILSAYVDADFANDTNDRKSISGYVLKVFNNVTFWKTKKQNTVSISSSEAEYVALSNCLTEVLFLKQLLQEILDVNISNINIFEDNQSTIKMASTLETKRTKHIDVKHHFIKDCILKNEISLKYVQTDEQIADVFTKSLSKNRFSYFRDKLNINVC